MEERTNVPDRKATVFDDILTHIGEYGGYQRRVYLLLCLPALVCAWHQVSWVFLGMTASHRCLLPFESLSNASFALPGQVANMSLPWDAARDSWSQCRRLDANFSEQYFEDGVPATQTVPCEDWVFDHSKYTSSAVFEFVLVCGREWQRAGSNFMMMFGELVGSILFGDLSDRFGRRPAFFSALVLEVAAGILASVAPQYWNFVIFRFLLGVSVPGVYITAYVLGIEMVGPSKRQYAGVVLQIFFSIGYMLTALFAFLVTDWRNLQLALSVPGLLFLVYWWVVPESPRWLIGQGQVAEASKVLQRAAKINKSDFAGAPLDEAVVSVVGQTRRDSQLHKGKSSLLHVWGFPNLRKNSAIIFLLWFINGISYYGLSWNSGKLGGNDYVNFVISGAVEIPAYLLVTVLIGRVGRKPVQCASLLVGAAALILTVCVPAGLPWLLTTLAMLGKFAVTASCGTTYILSAELFPTCVRNAGMGVGSTMVGLGAMLASFIVLLSSYWQPLPFLIMGCFTLTSGLLCLLLPETLHRDLPDSLEDGENFTRVLLTGNAAATD